MPEGQDEKRGGGNVPRRGGGKGRPSPGRCGADKAHADGLGTASPRFRGAGCSRVLAKQTPQDHAAKKTPRSERSGEAAGISPRPFRQRPQKNAPALRLARPFCGRRTQPYAASRSIRIRYS